MKGGGRVNCMKCGREIPDGQVFCPGCLEGMATYPIAPGTHVHIPKRPTKAPEKKAKELTPADQINLLKKSIRWLLVTVAVLAAALAILAFLLLQEPDQPQLPTGRNFTTAPR